jgi:hypothetical protein
VYTQVFTTFKPMMIAISQAAKTRRRTTATVSREFMVDWCILLLFVGGVSSRQHTMFYFVRYKVRMTKDVLFQARQFQSPTGGKHSRSTCWGSNVTQCKNAFREIAL